MKVARSSAPSNTSALVQHQKNSASLLPRIREKMKRKFAPVMLGRNFNGFHKSVAYAVALGSSREELFGYFTDAEEFGTANFLFSLKQGKRHGVKLLGDYFELEGKPITSYVDVGFWTKVMFYAMIRRDKEAITILKGVDKSIWSTTSLSGDVEFDFAFADLLKGLYTPGVDIAKLLESAMLAYDPDVMPSERLPSIGDVFFPVVRLIRTVFAPNGESEFNELMYEALKQHKMFYADKVFNSGALSFPLMAIAAYAFDQKGYRLTVESDYLLPWMVEGDFEEMSQGPLPKRFDLMKHDAQSEEDLMIDRSKMYRVFKHGADMCIGVMVGGIASYELKVKLTPSEVDSFNSNKNALGGLADKIARKPSDYESRKV